MSVCMQHCKTIPCTMYTCTKLQDQTCTCRLYAREPRIQAAPRGEARAGDPGGALPRGLCTTLE